MISGIQATAVSAPAQAQAAQASTTARTGRAPTAPITTPQSATEANVSRLFQVTSELSSQLRGVMDGAEARRLQGHEGFDMATVAGSVAEIQDRLAEMRQRDPSMGRTAKELSSQLETVITQGVGSVDRLAETISHTQQRLADKYGYIGNTVNRYA